jgi:hypothetical protein
MKRTYRITVEFTAAFERKISSRAWARHIQAKCVEVAPEGWTVTGATVRSHAIPKPAAPPLPNPQETLRNTALAALQEVATRASRYIPSAPNPRVRRWPNRVCGSKFGDRMGGAGTAHAHITPGMFYVKGKRLGRLRGTICVTDKALDHIIMGTKDPVALILHEVSHLRFRTGHAHDGRRFQESFERLERDYLLNEVR